MSLSWRKFRKCSQIYFQVVTTCHDVKCTCDMAQTMPWRWHAILRDIAGTKFVPVWGLLYVAGVLPAETALILLLCRWFMLARGSASLSYRSGQPAETTYISALMQQTGFSLRRRHLLGYSNYHNFLASAPTEYKSSAHLITRTTVHSSLSSMFSE